MPQVVTPDAIPDWLKVLATGTVAAGSTLIAMLGVVKRPLEKDIDGLGKRLDDTVKSCERNATSIDALERQQAASSADRSNLHERMGQMAAENTRLQTQLTDMHADIMTSIRAVGDSLNKGMNTQAVQLGRLEERLAIEDRVNQAVERVFKVRGGG